MLADPRGRNRTTYDIAGEIWAVIVQRLGITSSSRDWDNVKYSDTLREDINALSGCEYLHLPHSDTIKYLLENIAPEEFNKVLANAFIQMRRAKRPPTSLNTACWPAAQTNGRPALSGAGK